jgi:hypothetical protein
MLDHSARGSLTNQESREASDSPAALEFGRVGLEDAAADKRSGIEDRDFRRTESLGRFEEAFDVSRLGCVAVDRNYSVSVLPLIDGRQGRRGTRRCDNRVAFPRERAHERRAKPRPHTDYDCRLVDHYSM